MCPLICHLCLVTGDRLCGLVAIYLLTESPQYPNSRVYYPGGIKTSNKEQFGLTKNNPRCPWMRLFPFYMIMYRPGKSCMS